MGRTDFFGEGYDVVCPQCGGRFHETTEFFDNLKPSTGKMFRLKKQYGKNGYNWSTFPESEGMRAGDLECPQCGALYCGGGHYVKLVDPIPGFERKQERDDISKAAIKEDPEGVSEEKGEKNEDDSKEKQEFTCEKCGGVFKSMAGLKSHMRSCLK